MRPDLVGRDHEALILDRARPHQHLPVIARRRQGERRRDRDYVGSPADQRAVQLRKADVVTDAESNPGAVPELGYGDLVAGLLLAGLLICDAVDLDVKPGPL